MGLDLDDLRVINKETSMKPVIIETSNRYVAFGYTDDTSGESVVLERARCAIYWGTTGGIDQLAATGPTDRSRIGALAPMKKTVHHVIRVTEVSEEAAEKWLSHATYGG